MTVRSPLEKGDFSLLFTSLEEAMQDVEELDAGATVRFTETSEIATEIQELRAITEQVNYDSAMLRSLTLG